MSEPGSFARTYNVELLCRSRPAIDKRTLLASLRKRCPGAEALDESPDSGPLAFFHRDHPVKLADATIPAQTFVAVADGPPDLAELEPALQQSWQFPGARDRVQGCTASVLVTDLMCSSLPYQERLGLFQAALAAVVEVVPCEALRWVPTQQLVDPQVYLADMNRPDSPKCFAGAVNVRLFNIANTPGTRVMDTLGLAALGLPDVQCHFRQLDPNQVAPLLYNLALYLFQQGDVIADGHTVPGCQPQTRWPCRHEKALIAPSRVVLDIDPGPPFAAGNRH